MRSTALIDRVRKIDEGLRNTLLCFRKEFKISQEELASALNISRSQISRVENGVDVRMSSLTRYLAGMQELLHNKNIRMTVTLDLSWRLLGKPKKVEDNLRADRNNSNKFDHIDL